MIKNTARSYNMKKSTLILMAGLLASSVASAWERDTSPARILHKVTVCKDVQIPIYGMIERPASNSEVFTGALIGGAIGNQFGSGSGKDAMTVIGVLGGASRGGQRVRERVIVDYRTQQQCWSEWQ
jgi:outer membrane lipoprotein SlyB